MCVKWSSEKMRMKKKLWKKILSTRQREKHMERMGERKYFESTMKSAPQGTCSVIESAVQLIDAESTIT